MVSWLVKEAAWSRHFGIFRNFFCGQCMINFVQIQCVFHLFVGSDLLICVIQSSRSSCCGAGGQESNHSSLSCCRGAGWIPCPEQWVKGSSMVSAVVGFTAAAQNQSLAGDLHMPWVQTWKINNRKLLCVCVCVCCVHSCMHTLFARLCPRH